MNALLVRIGVDQAYGRWNAPVDADGNFVFVPIPEKLDTPFHGDLGRGYGEVVPALERFCASRGTDLCADLRFPAALRQFPMHLDPDFEQLTYGDVGDRRGSGMVGMSDGDLIVFYSGLRPVHPCEQKLIYALVGLYVVKEVVRADSIPADRWRENAHTRKVKRGPTDIVVRAKAGVSGRLQRCLPVGEWRDAAYRVRTDVLNAWGGLSVTNGYVQRSAVPPSFTDPEGFYDWFRAQGVPFARGNGWE